MQLRMTVLSLNDQIPPEQISGFFDEQGGNIGRLCQNQFCLPDDKRYVSKKHAAISFGKNFYFLTDTSTNGTYLIDRAVSLKKGDRIQLVDGERIKIGDYILKVEILSNAPPPPQNPAEDFGIKEPIQQTNKEPITQNQSNGNLIDGDGPVDMDNFFTPTKKSDISSSAEGLDTMRMSQGQNIHGIFYPKKDGHPRRGLEPEIKASELIGIDEYFKASEGQRASERFETKRYHTDSDKITENKPSSPSSPPPGSPANQPKDKPENENNCMNSGVKSPNPWIPRNDAEAKETNITQNLPDKGLVSPGQDSTIDARDLIDALLNALGIMDKKEVAEDEMLLLMQTVGEVFRELVDRLIILLKGRSNAKNMYRIPNTLLKSKENNPLKQALSLDHAIRFMLIKRDPGYINALQAVREAYEDINDHELVTKEGIRASLMKKLTLFSPSSFEKKYEEGFVLQKKAKCWDDYSTAYRDIVKEVLDRLYDAEFARAYEEKVSRLRTARKKCESEKSE